MSNFYTYPIIGIEEHFPDHGFHVELTEMEFDSNEYTFKLSYELDEPTVKAYIDSGFAGAAVRVNNRAFFHKVYFFDSNELVLKIPLTDIGDNFTFEFHPRIIAMQKIPGYVNMNAELDRRGYAYNLEKGNLLALSDKIKVKFEQNFEVFNSSGNFIKLRKTSNYDGVPFLEFKDHAVYITMSDNDFEVTRRLNNSTGKTALIGNILFPVILDLVWRINKEELSEDDWPWVEEIKESINTESNDLFREIQEFLENPIITSINAVNQLIVDEE
jgi:hypothetical protein